MSRGWESKDVEGQIEEVQTRRERPTPPGKTKEVIAAEQKLDGLEMNRTRILNELHTAMNPRYRTMLEANLLDVEQRIADAKRTSSLSGNSA